MWQQSRSSQGRWLCNLELNPLCGRTLCTIVKINVVLTSPLYTRGTEFLLHLCRLWSQGRHLQGSPWLLKLSFFHWTSDVSNNIYWQGAINTPLILWPMATRQEYSWLHIWLDANEHDYVIRFSSVSRQKNPFSATSLSHRSLIKQGSEERKCSKFYI